MLGGTADDLLVRVDLVGGEIHLGAVGQVSGPQAARSTGRSVSTVTTQAAYRGS